MLGMHGVEFNDYINISFDNCVKSSFHVTCFQIEFDRYLNDEEKYQFLVFFDNKLSELLMVDLYPDTLVTIPKFVHINEYQKNKVKNYFDCYIKNFDNDYNFDNLRNLVNSTEVLSKNICQMYTCLVNAKQAVTKRLNEKEKKEISEFRSQIIQDHEMKDILKKYESLSNLKDKLEYITELKIYYNIISENKEKLELVAKLEQDFDSSINEESIKDKSIINSSTNKYNISWGNGNATKTDLIELLTAIFQCNVIKGKQIDIIDAFSEILNIDFKNFYSTKDKLLTREDKAKFLTRLVDEYEKWYIKG